jgi:REP-associated tyrosine transposase
LTGGGLVRSAGGWRSVRAAYRQGIRLTSDGRILGSSEFVEQALSKADEGYERRIKFKAAGLDLDAVIDTVCAHFDIMPEDLSGSSRRLPICHARSLISYLAVRELRMSGAAVARRMNLDRSSVSRAIARVSKEPRLMKKVSTVLSVLMPGSIRKVPQQ